MNATIWFNAQLADNFKVNLLKGGQPRKFAPIVEEQKQK